VVNVNDAPTLAGVPAGSQSVSTGVAAALDDFTVADVDTANLTVTLTATNGSIGGLTGWTVSGAGNNIYSKTDSISNLNTTIAAAQFTATAAGVASIGISVDDGSAPTVTGLYHFSASAPIPIPIPIDIDIDSDTDTVPDKLENLTPRLGTGDTGDGNGDGVPDASQRQVTSSPVPLDANAAQPQNWVTLVADSVRGRIDIMDVGSANITQLAYLPVPGNLPSDIHMPLGLIDFKADVGTLGVTESFSLYVDASLGANGYWSQDSAGTWVNLASTPYGGTITQEGDKLRFDFVITDGGIFDSDHQLNGVITASGATAYMELSIVAHGPDLPTDGFWF
jgi:hypothetical protein